MTTNMTHPPQEVLIKVMCSERLPSKAGSYIVKTNIRVHTDYFNGKRFSYNFHKEITHWYEPATRIVLTVEELQDLLSDARDKGFLKGVTEIMNP